MKKKLLIIMGFLALFVLTPAIVSCSQYEENEDVFKEQEFVTFTGRAVTRSAEGGEGGNTIGCDNRIALAGCDTLIYGETLRIAVELRWTEGYVYVTNGVTGPMSTVSIGNVWFVSNHQGSVGFEGQSTAYWAQISGRINGIIFIHGTYITSGSNPHPVDFHLSKWIDHTPKNLHFKDEDE